MKQKIPQSPFSTRLSGSAKETELRLRNIFQWKKKRPPALLVVVAVMSVLVCCNLVSCQVQDIPSSEGQTSPEAPVVSQSESEDQGKTDVKFPDTQEAEPDGVDSFSFEEIRNYEFYFSSGVGAWATTLMIHPDGSFDGVYHDSDMGTTGEGYPSGTQYYCAFEGQFTPPVKVNEYTYSTRISTIRFDNEVGTEEIRDGIRYIYSDAYGLQDAENILIYLPGAPLAELPKGFLGWVGYNDLSATEDTELPFFGLYNEATESGFSGYETVGLMDMDVSLWRDGYAQPAGPGSQVPFFQEAYDGSETVEVLEDWEPIYGEGDYWANHSWENFEALCYHSASEGGYSVNTIDTTRSDLRTYRGIRVGDSRKSVLEAYPEAKSGDYWGRYPGEDYLWYCDNELDLGPALLFFFEDGTVSSIVLTNMFN